MFIHILAALVRSEQMPDVHASIASGEVHDAGGQLELLLGNPAKSRSLATEMAMVSADLALARDLPEDAEESSRRAVKLAVAGHRGRVRVVSCRATAFMSLYQHRFSTATSCLRRIIEDEAATPTDKIEAQCALSQAQFGQGRLDHALRTIEEAQEAVAKVDSSALRMMVSTLRADLHVQIVLRAHESFSDHVFCQLPMRSQEAAGVVDPRAQLDSCLATYGGMPVVTTRLRHLRALLRATSGDLAAIGVCDEVLLGLRRCGIGALERSTRIELALAAILQRQPETARAAIEPLCGRGAEYGSQRWQVELWYCQAKLSQLEGRLDDNLRHYQRYALESFQCTRAEYINEVVSLGHRAPAANDDVHMRLPSKYRRAYRYLIEHLGRASLTVREVAEQINVTERALQLVFRTKLGMSPAEVIRRARVERVRNDLLRNEDACVNVVDAAARWGIHNRATLVASYRRVFGETPAETLAARDAAMCA